VPLTAFVFTVPGMAFVSAPDGCIEFGDEVFPASDESFWQPASTNTAAVISKGMSLFITLLV
jgi:hypothetical protein